MECQTLLMMEWRVRDTLPTVYKGIWHPCDCSALSVAALLPVAAARTQSGRTQASVRGSTGQAR